jgi:hypothetical protein
VINKYPNGTWHGEVTTFGWLPDNLRRGIRYEQSAPVVTIEAAFEVGDGGVPVEVEAAPAPSSFVDPVVIPTPIPSQTPEPEPTASVVPSLNPQPTPTPEPTQTALPEPTPIDTPSPTLEPIIEATQATEPTPIPAVVPEPEPSPSVSEIAAVPVVEPSPIASDLAPDLVPTEPTQVVTLEAPSALAIIPGITAIFQAAEAFMNIGSDMTDEQREESQSVVVAAVIVGQLAIRKTK